MLLLKFAGTRTELGFQPWASCFSEQVQALGQLQSPEQVKKTGTIRSTFVHSSCHGRQRKEVMVYFFNVQDIYTGAEVSTPRKYNKP
jgi:hypothetical protein